ncbi:aminotransferase class IV [Salisediminibacterium halotolerans]|uniref:D-alanine transaminase n=1 Tax=Salisediminibacterium halotolerans TaxID=517425 RepID=A0A1H9U3B6_9BACI|nr:aminotransferase class IV [Salisediminibacterium haloalkalitolerans]SES04050.1 D-alanine transaminase [Salisediminibacterium haloalkalitolerans]
MPETAYYEDRFVEPGARVVPLEDRGHQFGDGIYEVIRVYNGVPFLLDEHLARLLVSADAIDLELPYSIAEIRAICEKSLERAQLPDAEIYIQVTRGSSPRAHAFPENVRGILMVAVKHARTVSEEKRQSGVPVMSIEENRWKFCYIKSLNLLPNVLAKEKAKNYQCHEAVYVDEGIVKEGSSSNIFAVKDGVMYTYPPEPSILHGISRQFVIDLALRLGMEVKEEKKSLSFFKSADELFLTSTTMEILAVSSFDDTDYSERRPITRKLAAEFRAEVERRTT